MLRRHLILSFSLPGFIDFVKFDLSSKTTYQLRENFFNTEKYEEEKDARRGLRQKTLAAQRHGAA